MKSQLLFETESGRCRVAVVEDRKLTRYLYESEQSRDLINDIYLGRVLNIVPALNSAFIDIGRDKTGFLPLDEAIDSAALPFGSERAGSADIRPSQEVLVQVKKDAVGTKGPKLTRKITLTGHAAVLLPLEHSIGISKKITDIDSMSRLKNVQESLSSNGMGLIFRTASQTMGEEAIVSEIEGLKSRWNSIVTSVERVKAPSCLYRHSHLFERCLRDFDLDSFDAILADGQNTYNLCQKAFEEIKPGKIMPIGLYSSEIPLFDVYKVDSMLDKALARKVYLKSGGYLVIDQTEAMTVIDVNSGTYVKPTDAESEAVSINLEAAGTIARLLRLLDIGGIVVVDFIDMSSQSNRELLLGTLRESLRSDHLPTEVLGITRLGLVEMTRKRVGLSLKQRLYSECTCCQGGFVESHELIARRILHALRRKSQGCPGMAWRITTGKRIADLLMAYGTEIQEKACITIDERHGGRNFTITPVETGIDPDCGLIIPQYIS